MPAFSIIVVRACSVAELLLFMYGQYILAMPLFGECCHYFQLLISISSVMVWRREWIDLIASSHQMNGSSLLWWSELLLIDLAECAEDCDTINIEYSIAGLKFMRNLRSKI